MQQPRLLLEGKYEIISKIREGGMGTIYRVRHRLLDEVRVVKIMQPHVVADSDLKRRFIEEAKIAIRLKHPNVCTLHDFAVDEDGTAYLVMEFIDGVNMGDFLKSRGLPPIPLTLEIAHQALLALGYLHRKEVIHRDVAPDNLMLAHDDEGHPIVKLIDLGIAKAANRAMDLTATGVFLGKLKYASPEQYGTLAAGERLDGRSDLYGLGVVLYELLTGLRPFKGESPAELLRAHLFSNPLPFSESDPTGRVPQELRAVVLHALEKRREDRFANAEEFDREIVSLREQLAPDEVTNAMAVLSTIRSTPPSPPDSVTPSAQDRLDRQFGQHTTPSPSPPLSLLSGSSAVDEAAPTIAVGPSGATPGELEPAGGAKPGTRGLPPTAPLPRTPPGAAKKPARRSRRSLAIALGVAAVAALLLWHPWTASPPAPETAPLRPTALPQSPAAAEPTVAAPSPVPTAVPTAEPTAKPTPDVDRAEVANARMAALRARDAADEARAPSLATSGYRRAAALQSEAEGLASRGNHAEAKRVFESSARLFAQSASAARIAAAQPTATAVRVAEAPTAMPRPTAPAVVPTAAPTRVAEVVHPTPAPAVARGNPAEEKRIREAIRKYSLAWSTKDAKLLAEVYPGGVDTFKEAFRVLSSQVVNIEIASIEVDPGGTTAQVVGNEITVATPRAGTEQRSNVDVTFQLQKTGDHWIIVRRNARG